jgi:hypothetical protein
MPPYKVLHTALMNNNADKIREAVVSNEKPMAIVFPSESSTHTETLALIKASGLWFAE